MCYSCNVTNEHICSPLELFGNATACPEGVEVCYKSWSGENEIEICPKLSENLGGYLWLVEEGQDGPIGVQVRV